MDTRPNQATYDWGQTSPTAPTIKRASPLSWLCASAFAGVAFGLLVTAISWRALPGLPAPRGSFPEHLAMWSEMLVHLAIRAAFASEAQLYGQFWSGLASEGRAAIAWRASLGIAASLLPGACLFKSYMTPRDALIHLRGSMRHDGPEAAKLLRSKTAADAKVRPDHEVVPGIAYPAGMWERHVLVVAGTGAGKSTAIKPLIDKVVKADERVLIFDPKGEFTMGFDKPAIVAPWDKRSFAWDIARDLRNIGEMRRFAAAMIQDSHDPMWANASRQLMVGFIIYLKRTRGNRWGWRELADLVAMPQTSMLPMMRRYHPEAVRAVERASVTTQGILINLSSFCASIFDLADAWGDTPESKRISFVEWTLGKSRQRQVILQGHGSYTELSKSYARGIIEVVSAIVNSVEMEDDPNRKLWLICDEFPQMGKVPIRSLLEVGRSRGFRCVLACQDLAQLEEIHGELMIKALVSLCGTLLIGQIMQGDTAEKIAKALGTREVERPNVSWSYGGGAGSGRSTTLAFSRDELAIYKPSELASRLGPTPDGKGVVMALITGGHAYELFWPRFQIKRTRLGYVPAAWTLGVGRDDDVEVESELTQSGDVVARSPEDRAQSSETDSPDRQTANGGPYFVEAKGAMQLDRPSMLGETEDAGPANDAPEDGEGDRPDNSAQASGRDSLVSAPTAYIGEDIIGALLRASLEVSVDASPVAAALAECRSAAAHPDAEPEAIASLVTESVLDALGGRPVAEALKIVEAMSSALDGVPGPRQIVQPAPRIFSEHGSPDSGSKRPPANQGRR